MNRTLNQVQEVVSVLTANEQQLLKATHHKAFENK